MGIKYIEDVICRLCGDNVFEASKHGAYLKRVNEKGKGIEAINECAPGCNGNFGNHENALLGAINSTDA